ncbi:MAG: glycoside hydrolase family 28 protein, partial [Candidatus Zixiibacteriota bacterium]
MTAKKGLLIVLLGISAHIFAVATSLSAELPEVYNVKKYGAVGDGKKLDSPAINDAVAACHKSGGGTVYFPPGTYLSGSIRLKSNVELHIAKGATIKAAPNSMKAYDIPDDNPWYRPIEYADFGHCFWKNSLIWAVK